MAVAELEHDDDGRRRGDKVDRARTGQPAWLATALGWAPKKLGEGKSFLSEVRSELKKVTWPSQKEVYSTTIVVIATTVFFGFYLWLLDLGFSRVLSRVLKG
jgi:preprotein translocase subunit SecE